MATYEETLDTLNEDQQRIITDKIKEAKGEAEEWARTELQKEQDKLQRKGEEEISKVKKEIRDQAKTVRKPDQYTSDKDIKAYVHSWEGYKQAMNLADAVAIASFLTYLDPVSRKKLSLYDQSIGTMSWSSFRAMLIKTLGKPQARMALKHKLRNLKQMPNETVNEFYNRMLELSAEAYTNNEQSEKERTLREVLCLGLKSEATAVEIMEHENWDFKEALEYAIKRDTAITARRTIAEGENAEIAILKINDSTPEASRKSDEGNTTIPEKRCYNCNSRHHLVHQCKANLKCYFCNKKNHVKKDCLAYRAWLQKKNGGRGQQNPESQSFLIGSPLQNQR